MFLTRKRQVAQLKEKVSIQEQELTEVSSFIRLIGEGKFDIDIPSTLKDSTLTESLSSVKDYLRKLASDESQRNWLNEGLAKFSDILRNKESLDFTELCNSILKNVVNYVSANQGAIFIIQEEDNGEEYLDLAACYAYDRKKYLSKRINPGEGILGQCMLEKDCVYLRQVPEDYINISSGLGEARPRSIFLSPLKVNDKVFGVIELASFQDIDEIKRNFIIRLSENVAATIKDVRESDRVLKLLSASQAQSEQLRSQEEELRQNLEEMQATQEEMQRKTNEITRVSAEMTSILNGINKSMATIEFAPDGTILTANPIFLDTMKYRLADITGRHHRLLVPSEICDSPDYGLFWKRLSKGESFTGIFKRMAADGTTVWLSAIYNPIFDGNGNVIKVVKFASNVTNEQELLAEAKGMMKGIDATMATIEFAPDGTILNANQNFLECMGYHLEEIRGRHHRMFLSREDRESFEYASFWKRLGSGEAISGEFHRIAADGSEIILKAIYNPIFNAAGQVVKVSKFAIALDSSSQLQRMASIEEAVLR